MNEPPGARLRIGLAGLTTAEYFAIAARTFCCSSTTSSASPRRVPRFPHCWAVCRPLLGYQAHAGNRDGRPRSATSTKTGSITSVQAVHVPADDLTDPAPATTFTHLDATTVLSAFRRRLFTPATDPLASSSDARSSIVGEQHCSAVKVQEPAGVPDLQDTPTLGHHRHSELCRGAAPTVNRARKIPSAVPLAVPSTSPRSSPAKPGVYVRVGRIPSALCRDCRRQGRWARAGFSAMLTVKDAARAAPARWGRSRMLYPHRVPRELRLLRGGDAVCVDSVTDGEWRPACSPSEICTIDRGGVLAFR